MNAARNASANVAASASGMMSGAKSYIMYGVIAIIIVVILYQFVFKSASLDVDLASTMQPGNPTMIKSLKITQGDLTDGKIRIKPGGTYTLSFWMNIKAWGGQQPGVPQSVLNILDDGLSGQSLLSVLLYPNDPQMMVRVNMGSTNNYNCVCWCVYVYIYSYCRTMCLNPNNSNYHKFKQLNGFSMDSE
jgi:hypothetical protein